MVASIAAVFSREARHRASDLLDRSLTRLDHWGAMSTARHVQGPSGLGVLCWQPPGRAPVAGQASAVHHTSEGQLSIVADARIDNADALSQALAASWPRTISGAAELILAAYCRWGAACADRLRGDFAFVVYDGRDQSVYAARDAFGCKPLYYVDVPGLFALASEPKGLLVLPEISKAPDEDWIADALVSAEYEPERTFFRDVRRLRGGTWARAGRDGVRLEQYWPPPDVAQTLDIDESSAVEKLRDLFVDAVRYRIASSRGIGCELSGGLDSASIARVAAGALETRGKRLVTFSHVDPDEWPDGVPQLPGERPWIERTIEGTSNIDAVFASADGLGVLSAFDALIDAMDFPGSDVMSTMSDAFSPGLIEHDVGVMLTGFGGDEVVTSGASSLPRELANSGQLLRLWRELAASGMSPVGTVSKYLRAILRAALPQPVVGRLVGWRQRLSNRSLQWDSTPVNELVCEEFYQSARIQDRIARYADMLSSWSSVREKQIELVHRSAHVANRMESYAAVGRRLRLEYRAPLLDRDLIEFHLSLPATLKRRHGIGRYVFRLAVDGLVPHEVAWRVDKTAFTIPALGVRYAADRDAMLDLVESVDASQPLWRYVRREPLLRRLRSDEPLVAGFWVLGVLLAYQWRRTYI